LWGAYGEWLATVANVRVHGTTQKVVADAFAVEQPELQPLPAMPFDALLKLERRVSNDGLVSVSGNYYSVPDRTRRIVEVHQLPDTIRILDQGRLIAVHPVLEGRKRTRIAPEHRNQPRHHRGRPTGAAHQPGIVIAHPGEHIGARPLDIYQAIADRLAQGPTATEERP
jgi:hypothetical protein